MLVLVIGEILPPAVAAAEAFGDDPDAEVFPGEHEAIANAVGKRRREFATARACARAALARLGLPPTPILRGERGAPQWPPGVVGSITHCAGYRACAVARRQDVVTVGVDAEPHGPLPDRVLTAVASDAEQTRLAELSVAVPDVHWDRLLFSAKESVYKAWYPLTGRWLGFDDAAVDFSESGQFSARILLADAPIDGFSGRWLVAGGLLVTAIAVEA
ncbi:MAG TPA: 4'-phosphopantetheinyl transferase superfamily protein [Streptosporangiaceae bacterium]